jgi:hypothetical protein
MSRRYTIIDASRTVMTRLEKRRAFGHFSVTDLTWLKAAVATKGEMEIPVVVGLCELKRDIL